MITLFTPSHNPQYLARLQASLAQQTCEDFEWVIVLNGGAEFKPTLRQARVVQYTGKTQNVGELKHFACMHSKGDVLAEVDHDDELTPDCVASLARVFGTFSVDFVYSNCCEVNEDGSPRTYPARGGWEYRPFTWRGKEQRECVAFDPTPASFSRIWYAPNHIRAWRAGFYHFIGGHNPALKVLDDQDILCRTYIHGTCLHLDKCLYVQHYHNDQTFITGDTNANIQRDTLLMHDKYIAQLVERWCDLKGLRKIDLCGGHGCPTGYEPIDLKLGHDLNTDWTWAAPGSVGLIRAQDALEHLKNPIVTMLRASAVLAQGGWLLSETPSTDGRGAWQDPTHVSFWNENSFWYYTRQAQAKYINLPVMFQATRLTTHFPNGYCRRNNIPYVKAHLLKPMDRTPGGIDG